jgi:hypothetical protein
MGHKIHLACVFSIFSMLINSGCTSTTNNASATTTATTGYHDGKYFLTESEKTLTPEQLHLRIKEEARICADPRAAEIKKSMAGNALKLGVGIATGIGINPQSKKKTPFEMSKARMQAYNERIVELGSPAVDIPSEIEGARVEQQQTST